MSEFDDLIIAAPQRDVSVTIDTSVIRLDPGLRTSPPIPAMILTDEQNLAIETMVKWADDDMASQHFCFGGYAGTGKTTVIKTLIATLRNDFNVAVCAFTGKACNVLMRKGIPASTMHSLMYDVVEQDDGSVEFFPKPFIAGELDLIIVDEASMVSTQLYNDLMKYDKPVIFVGDPGQLEPVGDNPNLMKQPDFVLTKIHRQAEKSPILSLATAIRNGGPLQAVVSGPELIIKDKKISSPEVLAATQAICAKNKTRHFLNTSIRQYKSLPAAVVVKGEKLICLRNNSLWNVFNGMIFHVKEIFSEDGNVWRCNVEDEDGHIHRRLPIWKRPFIDQSFDPKDPALRISKQVVYCDYAYVITCHKSQGSEWEHVWVYDEWMPPAVWDMKRWRYTAITRAANKLTYCK